MRHHHSIVHGEKLSNTTCETCGNDLHRQDPTCNNYCDDCGIPTGSDHPSYQGKLEIGSCTVCGSSFEYYPSSKPGVYCGDCVDAGEHIPNNKTPTGSDHPRWNTVIVECDYCDAEFERVGSMVNERTFCSRGCYGGWRSEHQTGEDNPNYKHGDGSPSEFYTGDWSKNKKKALERDNYECQECGDGVDEIGRNPDVHHIDRSLDDVHDLSNLICLCPSCHIGYEHGNRSLSCLEFRNL